MSQHARAGGRSWTLPGWLGASRLEKVELSPIKAVELEASRIPGVVSLAQGIPSFDTPEPIKRFVEDGYILAKKIISEQRANLELLAKSLIEYETLSGDEIKDLLIGKKPMRESASDPAPRGSAVPPAGKPRPRPEAGDVAPQPQA